MKTKGKQYFSQSNLFLLTAVLSVFWFHTISAAASTLDLIGVGWTKDVVTYLIKAGNAVSFQAIADVEDAIADWNAVLGGTGAPLLVASGDKTADVVIQMKLGGGPTLGQTSFKTVSVFSCELKSVRILLSGKSFGESFSSTGILNVAKHELGHVFGLGHSDDPDDLMYFAAESGDIFGNEELLISDCDIAAVQAIDSAISTCSVPDSIECD